jgi:hypothetical protein
MRGRFTKACCLALTLAAMGVAQAQSRPAPLPIPPVPPPPPAASPFRDAPVPNRDIYAAGNIGSVAPEIAPGVVAAPDTYRGETFAPGAAPSDQGNRLFSPAPGVTLRLPLKE